MFRPRRWLATGQLNSTQGSGVDHLWVAMMIEYGQCASYGSLAHCPCGSQLGDWTRNSQVHTGSSAAL